ncbi:MAG: radical SAM protein [Candidatus Latescibacteria bacterium]|nr:radical SAM protein [Candidatus Latescibacterota bacterium]NIO57381.1 radical SAM protein [Candidatus Latescibacterota bacterium]
MYDPLALAAETEKLVVRGDERKYYRFRAARFYGGIATADCVGCCLKCAFCWAWNKVANPSGAGNFYGPNQVAHKITAIAKKHNFHRARLSGNEPTIARSHLVSLLERLPRDITFILETNGILLGHERDYAQALGPFPNLHVRVSIKGCSEDEFSQITGAEPQAFGLQLKALEHLLEAGVRSHPAVVVSFSDNRSVDSLKERLHRLHPDFSDFEAEEIFLNPAIEKRLDRRGLQLT